MYEAPAVILTNEQKLKFYRSYLRQFGSPDIKPFDNAHSDVLLQIFAMAVERGRKTIGILARNKEDMIRIGQVWLMSLKKRVYWECFGFEELFNLNRTKEFTYQSVNENEYVILMYERVGNNSLPIFAKSLISLREADGLYTLLISMADIELGHKLIDPFKDLDGDFIFPNQFGWRTSPKKKVPVKRAASEIKFNKGDGYDK